MTVSSNCTVYAIAKDSAGNTSSQSTLGITNIDKEAPTAPIITPSTTAPTNGNVTVIITYPSDAAVKQYSYDGKTWTDNNDQDDIMWKNGENQGNGTWHYRVNRHNNEYGKYETYIYMYDNLGNYTEIATNGATVLQRQYTLILTAGTGGSVAGAGTYYEGSNITITAIPNSEYEFVNWSDGVSAINRSFNITKDINMIGNFKLKSLTWAYTTSISDSSFGTVSVPENNSLWLESTFPVDSSVTYTFSRSIHLPSNYAFYAMANNFAELSIYFDGNIVNLNNITYDSFYSCYYAKIDLPYDDYVSTITINKSRIYKYYQKNDDYIELTLNSIDDGSFILDSKCKID